MSQRVSEFAPGGASINSDTQPTRKHVWGHCWRAKHHEGWQQFKTVAKVGGVISLLVLLGASIYLVHHFVGLNHVWQSITHKQVSETHAVLYTLGVGVVTVGLTAAIYNICRKVHWNHKLNHLKPVVLPEEPQSNLPT